MAAGTDEARSTNQSLLFVSYSHADAVWVQRFQVMLGPLLRQRRLRLWADVDIRAGQRWGAEIDAAVPSLQPRPAAAPARSPPLGQAPG